MQASLRAVLAVVLASGGVVLRAGAQDPRSGLDPITSGVMGHPITTSSAAARGQFLAGQRESDLFRPIDANEHFKAAVAADSTFAFAYLNVALTATSTEEFKRNLALAERYAAGASEAERLQIEMARKGFDNDLSDQLALGQRLVEQYPASPRAWLALAAVQGALNRNEAARTSIRKALALAPRMFAAHTALGNSYVFGEPRDFAQAVEHMQQAEQLAPDEPAGHFQLGGAYRAQRNLEKARAEYTRGHELNPQDPFLFVMLGHVNTFLGDYAAARADYDSAGVVGRSQQKVAFAPFRALVSVYAGDPAAAITEFNQQVTAVDGMGVPDPTGAKVTALTSVAQIAIHIHNATAAEDALKRLGPMLMRQADEAGNPAFKRGQQAQIAYLEGWWAARRGDYAAAQNQADRINQLLAPDANPRKLEPMHQLEGFIALYQSKYQDAATHFQKGNLLDPYIKYQLAVATEGAGDVAQAKQLFIDVANFNFNTLGFALVRTDAQKKASGAL